MKRRVRCIRMAGRGAACRDTTCSAIRRDTPSRVVRPDPSFSPVRLRAVRGTRCFDSRSRLPGIEVLMSTEREDEAQEVRREQDDGDLEAELALLSRL